MTREEVMNSISLKKRFCKDCNLPIAVFDNPYFYERLSTLDLLHDCIAKFDVFCMELLEFANEQEYFEYYNSVKDSVINTIKAKDEYQAFIDDKIDFMQVANKKNLYVEQNDGGLFISIDMKKANFSALRHYSDKIFDGCETWEQFISKFTYSQHIVESKYIRQVILGACNPKKQIRYEQYLMNILCAHIIMVMPEAKIYSLGEDEIIIEVPTDCGYSLNKLRNVVNSCRDGIGSLVRVELFELCKINQGWLKVYQTSEKIEFKCVDAEIYHQVVKQYFDLQVTENDLVFYHNGRLAKFLNEVENTWS